MLKLKPSPFFLFCIVGFGTSTSFFLLTWSQNALSSDTGQKDTNLDPHSHELPLKRTYERRLFNDATMAETRVRNWTYQEDKTKAPLRWSPDEQKKRIESACSSLGMNDPVSRLQRSIKGRVVVDDKHKLLACLIPKVACTNLGRILGVLTGIIKHKDPTSVLAHQFHAHYKFLQTYLKDLPPENMTTRINNYFSFVFVRDPFERLISAYRNKLIRPPTQYFKRVSDAIVKAYRANKTQEGGATFPEFAAYLSDPGAKLAPNPHWMPFYKLCRPCEVQYGFIGNLATFAQDLEYILHKNNLTEFVNVPKEWMGNSTQSFHRTDRFLRQYYSRIPKKMLRSLYRIYQPDYNIFNISLPGVIKEMIS